MRILADLAKTETALMNTALLILIKTWEQESKKIKFRFQENYNLAKSRLSEGMVKENWQNFLDHNARY